MRVAIGAFLVIGAAAVSPVLFAEQQAGNPLAAAQSLKCTFPTAATTVWRGGAPDTATGEQTFGFQIDAIDAKRRTARLVGSSGSAEVSAFLTDTGLNVIEQTPIGNFILTSVFSAGGEEGRFIAVHSRHVGDLAATPNASQHYGTCEAVK